LAPRQLVGPRLALATLWLYAPVRHADFLHYDDREYVVDNGHVSGG